MNQQATADTVSIIITTSPAPSHPDTGLIITVLDSITLLGLCRCPIIIICDGYKCCSSTNSEYKSGRITEGDALNYQTYLDRLSQLDSPESGLGLDLRIVKRIRRHGFAENVSYGLSLVETPYVLVYQHD